MTYGVRFNPDNFALLVFNTQLFPVLSKLEVASKSFTKAALSININIIESRLCGNPVFGVAQKGRYFNNHVFEHEPDNGVLFRNVTLNDIMANFTILTRRELHC
jgi:hypothetical protein